VESEPAPVTAVAEPVALLEPVARPVDDLARVEGIGPKISAVLVGAGVRTYRDLADADVDALRAILRSSGLRLLPSLPTWPEQARLLAEGDGNGVTALTESPTAGRESAAEVVPPIAVTTDPTPDPEPQRQVDPVPAPGLQSAPESRPETAVMPVQRWAESDTPAIPDDLRRIEGIGPKMANALNAAGITTYERLAVADDATIRAAISAAGLRFAPSMVTWARQARLLADDEAGFAGLTGRLVSGRDAGRG
jgi:predicted flap endonuclease-1-like 5' DNA nuclease